MIPVADIDPAIALPLPACRIPAPDEITEDGFGFFRDTWSIGHVSLEEAIAILREEATIIDFLDTTARNSREFERLAQAIEAQDRELLDTSLLGRAEKCGIGGRLDQDDLPPLEGLEIGVAGLSYALSAIGCLTAASCRSHGVEHGWSKCPVVFFVALPWRVEILAELVAAHGCGLGADVEREMATVYARSISDLHRLGERLIKERDRFVHESPAQLSFFD